MERIAKVTWKKAVKLSEEFGYNCLDIDKIDKEIRKYLGVDGRKNDVDGRIQEELGSMDWNYIFGGKMVWGVVHPTMWGIEI